MVKEDQKIAAQWCRLEFAGVNFEDQRLNTRFLKTSELLFQQPMNSINHACENWAAAKAAYRFFDNEKISVEKIQEPHFLRTVQRAKTESGVFAIKDDPGSVFAFDLAHEYAWLFAWLDRSRMLGTGEH
jgi:hypothetical protein